MTVDGESERSAARSTPDGESERSAARSTPEAHLRSQDWEQILAKLTTFAWRHTNRRSWEHAQDLASQAIADAFEHIDGWDPAAEPLLKNLCRRVFGLATKEWRRKRNTFEVAMEHAQNDQGELEVGSGEDPIDEVLDRRRYAESFRAQLLARLAGDEIALAVIEKMMDGEEITPSNGGASGFTPAQIRDARRRVFRHAERLSARFAAELDGEGGAVVP